MSSENALSQLLKGQPLAVDVGSIEEQLRDVWKDTVAPEDAAGDSSKAVARTSVLNLIAYVESTERGKQVSEVIGDLTVGNPCRAIVAIADTAARTSGIEAWISTHCHRPSPSSKVVCCEQISLQAGGQAIDELASTLVPFLVSDLPVFLWWGGSRLFESDFLKNISGVCDRIIVDSKQFTSPRDDFPRLAAYIETNLDRLAVSDVAWHRLMQWREVTAQFFDPPAFRDHLSHLKTVTVEFNERTRDGASVPPQAYLLVGWLAGRLQWNVVGADWCNGAPQFRMKAKDSHDVTVIVQPTQTTAKLSGHLVSFELRSDVAETPTFRIAKSDHPDIAETEIRFSHAPSYRRAVPLRIYSEAELIERQLEIFGHDPVYEQAIQMAAHIVDTLS